MNIKTALPLAIGLLLFAPKDLGAQKTEARQLGGFNKVSISGGFDKVSIVQGNETSVKITASGVALDKVLTETKGQTLEIGMKNGNYWDTKIAIVVTCKGLEEVSSSGSSDIFIEMLKAESFAFNASGSGEFTGEFDVKKLEINLSGSSDTKLKGRADEQEINISGSGDVDASKLAGNRAEVSISGSGDVKLNVERVRSSVSGSGEIDNVH